MWITFLYFCPKDAIVFRIYFNIIKKSPTSEIKIKTSTISLCLLGNAYPTLCSANIADLAII